MTEVHRRGAARRPWGLRVRQRPAATRLRRLAVVAAWAAILLAAWAAPAAAPDAAAPAPGALSPGAQKAVFKDSPDEREKLAARDPLEFLRIALKWSDERVLDYTCRFQKQDKIGGTLAKTETMQMKFRAKTFSVYLKWVGDVSAGQEALYVEGANDGKVAARPPGIVGVFLRKVMLDPTGKTALKHSRRPLTFAGMANMLRLAIPQCERARDNGDLTLTYEGLRNLEGRPTYVFKRILPQKHDYPCPVLILYVDRQFMVCVRTDAYDWDGTLLSQYIYTDLVINPGLKDEDFSVDNREYGFRLF
ncbi:MAG: DUF1571 domain-containing protein [Planctomycetota bacterium]|nr:DUF1571 domain-containing protein [Planctomycetota bacterium]